MIVCMEGFSPEAMTALLPALEVDLPLLGMIDVSTHLAALVTFVGLTLLFQIVQKIVVKRLLAISKRTDTAVDDVLITAIDNIRPWVYNVVALFVALQFYTLPTVANYIITGAALFAIVWQLIEVATKLIDFAMTRLIERQDGEENVTVDPNAAMASNMITLLARVVLWTLGLLFVLSNLGIEITSLIAGLGIGGVAIAFALQGILSDLFASFSLYFDKPFRIGDFVVIGTDSGTVEKIGIKTTRIKTLQGEELVVSNNELTTTRVQNFKKMDRRRVGMQFGVTYDTPVDKLKQIRGIIERIFDTIDNAELNRVFFTTFGDSALLFDVVYYVDSREMKDYLEVQEKYNFELLTIFAEVGIEFAFPTQTIYTKTID